MAILECLLVMITALFLATAATSEDHKAVEQVTGSLAWEQPLYSKGDYDGYLTPQSDELETDNHGIVKDTPRTAFIQGNPKPKLKSKAKKLKSKAKKMPRKGGHKRKNMPTQGRQGMKRKNKSTKEKLVEEFQSLHQEIRLTDNQCTSCIAGQACCWIPGDANNVKHCVQEVTPKSKYSPSLNWPKRKLALEVLVLPVGQGDCVAMYCPNGHLVMYDCGTRSRQDALDIKELRDAILENVKSVTIFISHADEDHYKYLPDLFPAVRQVPIDRVIIGGKPEDYTQIDGWIQDIKDKVYTIKEKCIGIGNCELQKWSQTSTNSRTDMNICDNQNISFDIIAANVGSDHETNQKSIVLKVTAGGRSVLLSGDIEGNAAETVASQVRDQLKSHVYQVSHHGACREANKYSWLKEIIPDEAFVSHGYNAFNWGHPCCVTILRLLSLTTIATGNPLKDLIHPFMCGKEGKVIEGETCHHIFSTYPTKDKICAVRFTIGKSPATYYQCFDHDISKRSLKLLSILPSTRGQKRGRSPSTPPVTQPKKKLKKGK